MVIRFITRLAARPLVVANGKGAPQASAKEHTPVVIRLAVRTGTYEIELTNDELGSIAAAAGWRKSC